MHYYFREAGLECHTITGINKNIHYSPDVEYNQSVNMSRLVGQWNAVKLYNEWRFVNVSWACSCVLSGGGVARPVRMLNEFYFLTDPDLLIGTHFPMNSNWQLLPAKQKVSMETFFNLPVIGDRYFTMGLQANENTHNRYMKILLIEIECV